MAGYGNMILLTFIGGSDSSSCDAERPNSWAAARATHSALPEAWPPLKTQQLKPSAKYVLAHQFIE